MERRQFLTLGAAGAAAAALLPQQGWSTEAAANPLDTPLAGSVYYTADKPGRWGKKIGGHLPTISKNGTTVTITTDHSMDNYHHYIVKHMLLDANFTVLAEKMFKPGDEAEALSIHTVAADYSGALYAVSVCNKHDTWIAAL